MALHMQCSDKNVIIPEGVSASIVQRALLEEGVKVDIMNHGVDVGTDVTAGKRRATQKLKEREQHGKKKANRVSVLARIDGRCRAMGRTGVMPTSTYGSSAVGADEGNIKRQKRNLAIATAKGLSAGTSSALTIEMTYGSEAQPDIKAHMSHIEAWLMYYDKYRTNESKRILMEAAWCKALARIDRKKKAGG